MQLANCLNNVPTTTDALSSPDLKLPAQFDTFLKLYAGGKLQNNPPSPNGGAYIKVDGGLRSEVRQTAGPPTSPAVCGRPHKQIDADNDARHNDHGTVDEHRGAVAPAALRRSGRAGRVRGTQAADVLAFMSPWLIGFSVFFVYPLIATVYYSFTNYDLIDDPAFVGLRNYVYMFTTTRCCGRRCATRCGCRS